VDIRKAGYAFQERAAEALKQETAAEGEKSDLQKFVSDAILKAFEAGFEAANRLCKVLQKTQE
jgi:hypothetical protein